MVDTDTAMEELVAAQREWRQMLRPDAAAVRGNELVFVTAARLLITLGRGFSLRQGQEGQRLEEATRARVQETIRQLRENTPELAEQFEQIIQGIDLQGDLTNFTVLQFRAFAETVRNLWHRGRNANRVRLEGREMQIDEAHTQLAEQLGPAANADPNARGDDPNVRRERTPRELQRRALGGLFSRWRRTESMLNEIDGGVGAWTRLFYRPIQAATDHFRVKRQYYTGRYRDLFQQLGRLPHGQIDLVIGSRTVQLGHGNGGNGMAELLGVLLHSGNRSNLAKMLIGKGWLTHDQAFTPTNELNDAPFWEGIAELERNGVITEAHWNWVRDVWALMEEMKPLSQNAHLELYGHYFQEIQRTQIERTMADGTVIRLNGGYVPSKLAPGQSRFERLEGMDALRADERAGFPTTGRGFTINRIEQFFGDVSIDIRLVNHHIDALLRFSILQPALHNAMRVLNHRQEDANTGRRGPTLAEQLELARPGAMTNVINPFLTRVAQQSVSERGKSPMADRFLNELRTRSGLAIMFGNLSNALQQVTGFFPAMLRVRPSHLMGAAVRFLRNPRAMANGIAQRSEFMQIALRDQMFDMMGQIEDLTINPSLGRRVQRTLRKEGYFLQSAFQNCVNLITWDGAYEQALRNNASEEEAIAQADSAVRETQGTMNPETLAAGEAGTAISKLILQFTSYFNMMANLNLTEARKAIVLNGGLVASLPSLTRIAFLGFLMPTLIADLIARAMRGQLDDEDDDGYDDELASWLFNAPTSGLVAMVPMVGPTVGSFVLRQFDDQPYNDRLGTPASVAMLETMIKTGLGRVRSLVEGVAGDEEAMGKAVDTNRVRDVVTLLAMSLNVASLAALGKPLEYGLDVANDRTEPYNAFDYARGLVTGTSAEGTRK